tara:strand:+ start:1864 stop:4110 length:2247 start_codon:yes stop_codon:yes gene_type:complete
LEAQTGGSASIASQPNPESFGLLEGRPRVTPTRTTNPPVIDGILDDEVWLTAAHLTEFTQQSPLDGAPATEDTDVYIAYDSDNIYFGFYAHYEDPSIMRANRVERDRASMDDLMTIYFDTFLDQQRGYDFDVNGYGVQGDGVMTVTGGRGGRNSGRPAAAIPFADRSWDALFDTGAQIVEDGYTAEMAIPFKSLRYPTPPEGEPHRWGFQIVREVKSKNEENQVWAPMSRDEASFFAQMGLIEGMIDLSTSRNIEILPTFTTIQYGELDTTQPIFTNQNPDPDAGVNLKYGLTSNLTADFTVNPDFSQIESDRPQIEVNQRYPLFFSELRPFFVEGSEIFNVTAPVTLVHTRTMVDPDYGAKLTGQVGRFTLGALGANDRAPGRVDDQTSSAFGQTAKTFIGRAKFDLYSESHIGAMVTDREFLDGYSRLAGLDSNFRLGSVTRLAVNAFGTNRQQPGSSEDTGNFLGTFLSSSGRNLNASVLAYQISPDFHTDVGFVRRRDQRNTQANIGYRFWPEGQLINWGPSVSYGRNYDFDGILQDETKSARMSFSFARSISLYGNVNYDMERWSQIDFQKSRFGIGGRANPSRSYSFGGNFSVGNEIFYSEAFLGHQVNWSVNGSVRPTDALQTNLNFSHRRFTDPTNNDEVKFDVKIIRAQSTFQFTDRLGLRNITEWNTEDRTFDFNMLFNYTVNAGTVFYVGYDDHYQQGDLLRGDTNSDGFLEQLYWTKQLQRTNRAIFMKFQYLFRY